MSAGFCVSIPKMFFFSMREVKSSDFMRLSAVFSFAFSRTSKKDAENEAGHLEAGIGRIQSRCPIPYSAAIFCSTTFSVESAWGCWVRRKSPSVWMRRFMEVVMASTRSRAMNSSAAVNVSRMAHGTSTLLRQHLETVSQRSRSIRPCRPSFSASPGNSLSSGAMDHPAEAASSRFARTLIRLPQHA